MTKARPVIAISLGPIVMPAIQKAVLVFVSGVQHCAVSVKDNDKTEAGRVSLVNVARIFLRTGVTEVHFSISHGSGRETVLRRYRLF